MKPFKAHTLIVSLLGIFATGTVFFHYVEGWSWLDSYFFTVVTISTVGYGELVPVTALGKLATTVFIFVGLGVFAVSIQQFAIYQMRRREESNERLFSRLGHHHVPDRKADPEDDTPAS